MISERNEIDLEQTNGFVTDLDNILGQALTVESIDTYADEALDKLIRLVGRTIEAYSYQPTLGFETKTEIETAAFAYYGLGDVEAILDHIADKTNELRDIDQLISRAETVNSVITPTDSSDSINLNGMGGGFQEKTTKPRLKTLLFILSNEFRIDIHDDEQRSIQKGLIGPDMMRKVSYYLVTAPTIERTVLVCDEEGNATFVFDSKVLKEFHMESAELLELTKTDLKDLIEQDPRIGKRLIFTDDFVGNMIVALRDKITGTEKFKLLSSQGETGKYLNPESPEDYMSVAGIASVLGLSHSVVKNAIKGLGASIGIIKEHKFYANRAPAYDPLQQEMIYDYLVSKGQFTEHAPDGYLSITGIARQLGMVDRETVQAAAKELGDTLGEIGTYRIGPNLTGGYSPSQQATLRAYLESKGLFSEQVPDDHLSSRGMSRLWHLSNVTTDAAIEELGAELGEIYTYRIGPSVARAYSPTQQEIIHDYLIKNGVSAENLPAGYLSAGALAHLWGVSREHSIIKAIEELSDSLGEVSIYRIKTRSVEAYSPAQQAVLYTYLESKGLFSEQMPDDYLSSRGMSKLWGMSNSTTDVAIKELSGELGEVVKYKSKSGHRFVNAYSPAQQAIIRQYIEMKRLQRKI